MFHKILLTTAAIVAMNGAALAADLPTSKGPPVYAPPPPPIFTWTGAYIGGQIGYQWGATSFGATDRPVSSVAAFLISAPAALSVVATSATITRSANSSSVSKAMSMARAIMPADTVFGVGWRATSAPANLIDGSIRGRVGYAWDRALIYATGGVAFGDFQNSYTLGAFGTSTLSTTRVGWTVGGGVEYAIDNNWSVRAEYRYTDFGRYYQFPVVAAPFYAAVHDRDNRVQVGFSYKFDLMGPAPVLAKY